MTIEDNFSKKHWIEELWEEVRGDAQTRDLIFGAVIDDMEEHAKEIAEEREDKIRDEVRDEIKEDLMGDPPEDLRAKVIKGLIEYPPAGMDESLEAWRELRAQIRDEARDDYENELGDLRLTIEGLREQIADLKGVEYRPPEPKKKNPTKGKVRR
jgi:hypothetical protein